MIARAPRSVVTVVGGTVALLLVVLAVWAPWGGQAASGQTSQAVGRLKTVSVQTDSGDGWTPVQSYELKSSNTGSMPLPVSLVVTLPVGRQTVDYFHGLVQGFGSRRGTVDLEVYRPGDTKNATYLAVHLDGANLTQQRLYVTSSSGSEPLEELTFTLPSGGTAKVTYTDTTGKATSSCYPAGGSC